MMKKLGFVCLLAFYACVPQTQETAVESSAQEDSTATVATEEPTVKPLTPDGINLTKALLYDKHTLEDTYPYKDTTRQFQWEKIKEQLALLENIQQKEARWAILRNYKNRNGEAPLVKNYHRDAYKRIADTLGTERYQGVPLYLPNDTLTPERYGQDGSLVKYTGEVGTFARVEPVYAGGAWWVPQRYILQLPDSVFFDKAIFVDRRHQNIATTERSSRGNWLIRSMNPATTGQYRPPYAQETPLGLFVLQEKKTRMIFLKDGSTATGGFAPYASRFNNGGYIHGIPTNVPATRLIEYSPSLGTTPRSHMCVRNATSHAQFIFDRFPVNETIIVVLE